jgi:hypothetical protein
LDLVDNDEGVLDILIISNEAHFHLSGYINKQNFGYLSDNNPMQIHEKPIHSEKVTLWCDVIRPYFFEENNWAIMEMQRIRQRVKNICFRQDGAMAYVVR